MDEEKENKQYRIKIGFEYYPYIAIADIIARSIFIYYFILGYFGGFILYLLNLLVFFAEIFVSIKNDKLTEKYGPKINTGYKINNTKISLEYNVPDKISIFFVVFGFFYLLLYVYNTFKSYEILDIILIVLVLMPIFIFSFLTVGFSSAYYKDKNGIDFVKIFEIGFENTERSGKTKNKEILIDVTKKFPDIFPNVKFRNQNLEIINFSNIDYNDVKIAKLESELKSINYKVEAWMLESVFLGGLAFTGFLTVIAANFLGKETEVFSKFIDHLSLFIKICRHSSWNHWSEEFQNTLHREDIFIFLMFLCLLSSAFFLLVISLRLRFSALILNIEHIVRTLSIFNTKENELFNIVYSTKDNELQKERLEKVSKQINIGISDADKLMKEIKPVVIMMSFYRNLAVILFFFVLFLSGFYFHPLVSIFILLLAFFTQAFRIIETYSKIERIKNLVQRH